MKKLLLITGVAEAATGVALMVAPALVGRLLLGAELVGVSVVLARVTGIALLALGVGSWPGPALLGMLTYNALGTVYFASLAFDGKWAGPLLWPAVGLHAVLAILLGYTWFGRPKAVGTDNQAGK
jgi:hypothetical protein